MLKFDQIQLQILNSIFSCYVYCRSSRSQMFFKIGVTKKFLRTAFDTEHLQWLLCKFNCNFLSPFSAATAQKMKFSIKDFFSKCNQIRSFLRIWSHLLKKPLMENFIFCAMCPKHFVHQLINSFHAIDIFLFFSKSSENL